MHSEFSALVRTRPATSGGEEQKLVNITVETPELTNSTTGYRTDDYRWLSCQCTHACAMSAAVTSDPDATDAVVMDLLDHLDDLVAEVVLTCRPE